MVADVKRTAGSNEDQVFATPQDGGRIDGEESGFPNR